MQYVPLYALVSHASVHGHPAHFRMFHSLRQLSAVEWPSFRRLAVSGCEVGRRWLSPELSVTRSLREV
jgi:hypothetical protein